MNLTNVLRSTLAGLLLLASVSGVRAQLVNVSDLHQFVAGNNDGGSPYSEVILGTDGAWYGTANSGGTNAEGIVYRMNRDGSGFTILHHFGFGDDGAAPFAGLIQGADGFLYGTTYFGGPDSNGTIFKINTNGSVYSVLHLFADKPDGSRPFGALIQGQDGALYGTTEGGGTGMGIVYKIDTNGNSCVVLHSFTNATDATQSDAQLVQASNGMLYGTTYSGGASFVGAVFKIDTNGGNYSVIHSFNGSSDGFSPQAGLVIGQDGWLYGTTASGGNSSAGRGTVFKLNTNGAGFSVLHTFTNTPDGADSVARVTQGLDGYLYGVTSDGGNSGLGTVFRVNTNGANYSVLHRFNGAGDGLDPSAGLFTTGDGVFYGTAAQGGNTIAGFGTVYQFTMGPTLNLNVSNSPPPLLVTGFSNQTYQVQFSTNLINWNFLTNVTLTNGNTQVIDAGATNSPARYYRALIP